MIKSRDNKAQKLMPVKCHDIDVDGGRPAADPCHET
jgi:hypothetical protein